ncbi:VOC family protein [Lactiplantibacillus herbarum]|uniref:VOC family protein n=1 Tax=Lactiplantibacillus herbarum TaxID=1670446 RepID=UPI00064E1F44|nr:VOC family protein [Lactiplantibacillus herbarum]
MISKMRVMLYVDDVSVINDFWQQAIGATVVETLALPEQYQGIVLAVTDEIELALFPKAFIRKFSPEVLHGTPSLMLFSDAFKTLHQQIPGAGAIVDNNGTLTFNFADPEGNYFVIAKK